MAGEEFGDFGGASYEGERPVTNEATTAEGSAKTPAIRLVLNGGGTTMDSATVPVAWFFSDALLSKKPQYVVLCDHELSLAEMKERERYSWGYRYLIPVKELVTYLQLFSPGRHHLVCVAVCGEKKDAFKRASYMLEKNVANCWCEKIYYQEIEDGHLANATAMSAIVAVEFEVPEALFAPRPDLKAAKLLWKWANLFFSRDPRDQCAYRKRLIFAFSAQLPIVLVMWSFFGILATLYTVFGLLFVMLVGFRPANVVNNFKRSWWWDGTFKTRMTRWDEWRRWDDGSGSEPKYLPIWGVPMFALLGFSTALTIVLFAIKHSHAFILLVAALAAILAVVLLISLVFRRVRKALANIDGNVEKRMRAALARSAEKHREREEARFARLYESLSLEANTGVTHVDVPAVARRVESNVTRFKLSFWATKAKVCKPFAKY